MQVYGALLVLFSSEMAFQLGLSVIVFQRFFRRQINPIEISPDVQQGKNLSLSLIFSQVVKA